MSRGVEDYTLTSILEYARQQDFDRVIVRFSKGPKNDQMKAILSKNDFVESGSEGECVIYGFDLKQQCAKPLPKWFSPRQPDGKKTLIPL